MAELFPLKIYPYTLRIGTDILEQKGSELLAVPPTFIWRLREGQWKEAKFKYVTSHIQIYRQKSANNIATL